MLVERAGDDALLTRIIGPQLALHGGVGGTGRDDIAANAMFCEFQAKAAHELRRGGLGCVVRCHLHAGGGRGIRANRDDGAVPAPLHAPRNGAAQQEHPVGIHGEAVHPGAFRQVHRRAQVQHPGRVHQVIERPQPFLHSRHQSIVGAAPRHVGEKRKQRRRTGATGLQPFRLHI